MKNQSKIKLAQECLQMMEFLMIEPENFTDLKNFHGGLENLHCYLSNWVAGCE